MKKNIKKTAILIILGFFILIQFFRIDKSVPETDHSSDFFVVANPPRRVITQIRTSCYDCHSFKTQYPWYSNFAPVSWMLDAHIKSGREHLNFSEYENYSRDESIQILKNIKETIEEN